MNTIYEKTLMYYFLAVIIGFSFLGFGITEAFKNYFYNEKNQFMLSQAKEISEIYNYSYSDNMDNANYFLNELKMLDEYSAYSFFITDNKFNVVAKSNDINNVAINDEILFVEKNKALSGEIIYGTDVFNNIFDEHEYFIAYPVNIDNKISAIVFITTSLKRLHSSISKIYILTIIFAIIASIIGLVIINISMSKTLKGITILNDAAKRISTGDFKHKIKIEGNDELSQLADSFNEMADVLDESEKKKQQFLSNIAHDLRSPITSIKGFLDAILDGTIPQDKINKYLIIIRNESERLNKLTNSVLDLNSASGLNKELVLKRFDINELLKNTVSSMQSRCYDKKLSIDYRFQQANFFVEADYEKIQRVLYNLIDNAIKFSDYNKDIIISTINKGNMVEISISNTGIEISNEEQKRVFDRLYKTDTSRGMDKTGIGLGLSIVKNFLNQHGEDIIVNSKSGFTTFSFKLKLTN